MCMPIWPGEWTCLNQKHLWKVCNQLTYSVMMLVRLSPVCEVHHSFLLPLTVFIVNKTLKPSNLTLTKVINLFPHVYANLVRRVEGNSVWSKSVMVFLGHLFEQNIEILWFDSSNEVFPYVFANLASKVDFPVPKWNEDVTVDIISIYSSSFKGLTISVVFDCINSSTQLIKSIMQG